MGDMIDDFNEKGRTLKAMLPKIPLTPEQKKLVLIAMEFGYATAFCERTSDANGS